MNSDKVQYHLLSREWEKMLNRFFEQISKTNDVQFFHPHSFDSKTAARLCRFDGRDLYYIQTIGKDITGYGMLRGWDHGYEIPSLGIIIHPDDRGRGLGKAFMKFLHDQAEQHHACRIRLKVYKANTTALNLYQKMGYRFEQEEREQLVGFCTLGDME